MARNPCDITSCLGIPENLLKFVDTQSIHMVVQAHMQARYVILRVLLEAGEDLVSVEKIIGEDGEPDLIVKLNRSKINSVGKKAIGDFLRKLQVWSFLIASSGKNCFFCQSWPTTGVSFF